MVLPRYVTLPQAATKLNTSILSLNRMIQSGKIKAVEIAGEIAVSENSLISNMKKEDLPEYKKFAHLAGQAIWVAEAARKYNTEHSNIIRWTSRGFIKVLGKEKNRTLLDEQDVAYCAEVHKSRGGQGKWVFNPDGTPYSLKNQENETPA